jgi:hypothetical protein
MIPQTLTIRQEKHKAIGERTFTSNKNPKGSRRRGGNGAGRLR